jgi:hypothetical protein
MGSGKEGPEPQTVWERPLDEVSSGMRIHVRAAVFSMGDSGRSGVTLTIEVPKGFHEPLLEDGRAATILLNPDEARGLSGLKDAAGAALDAAPPLYE